MRTCHLVCSIIVLLAIIAGSSGQDTPLPVSKDQDAYTPCAAYGKDVFLVCWQSGRLAKGDLRKGVTGESDIVGLRVAWDGKAFQIVWQDYRCGDRYEVYGARVSPEGKVLDEDGNLLVTQKDRHRYNPVVAPAAEGKSFVIWNGDIRLGTGTIAGGVFLTDGKVNTSVAIDSGGRKHGPGFEWVPLCLSRGPKNHFVAWTTDNTLGRDGRPAHVNAMVLDEEGKPTATLLVGGKEQRIRDPEAFWDGEAFVTLWHEAVQEGKEKSLSDAVFTSRISPEGKVTGLTRLAGSFAAPAAQACVASDGAGLSLAAYEQHPEKPETPIQIAVRLLKSK